MAAKWTIATLLGLSVLALPWFGKSGDRAKSPALARTTSTTTELQKLRNDYAECLKAVERAEEDLIYWQSQQRPGALVPPVGLDGAQMALNVRHAELAALELKLRRLEEKSGSAPQANAGAGARTQDQQALLQLHKERDKCVKAVEHAEEEVIYWQGQQRPESLIAPGCLRDAEALLRVRRAELEIVENKIRHLEAKLAR
jgi:hypothetical protein